MFGTAKTSGAMTVCCVNVEKLVTATAALCTINDRLFDKPAAPEYKATVMLSDGNAAAVELLTKGYKEMADTMTVLLT